MRWTCKVLPLVVLHRGVHSLDIGDYGDDDDDYNDGDPRNVSWKCGTLYNVPESIK